MTVPSVSNTAGTAAGLAALVTSTTVVNSIAGTAPFIYMSVATGIPPLIFASAVCGVGSILINYGVTHWAEGRVIDQDFQKWWPMLKAVLSVKTYSKPTDFPAAPPTPTPSNLNNPVP